MPSLVERVGSRAATEIQKFRDAASAFTREYEWLRDNPPPFVVSQEIMREYERILSRARAAGSTMQNATRAIDAVAGTFWRTTGQDLAGLGAPILFPLALVAGATATLLGLASQIRVFRERMAVFNELRAQNVEPSTAWRRATASVRQPGIFGGAFRDYGYIIAGGVAFALFMYSQRVK